MRDPGSVPASRRRALLGLLAASGLAVTAALGRPAHGQDAYPSRPIKIVLPYPAGGGHDSTARLIAQEVSQRTGATIVIENRPGANGNVGVEAVVRSAPDGYTLVYNGPSVTTNQWIYPRLGFDPVKDLVPVLLTAKLPLVLLVNTSVPAKSLAEFVAYAKANPGRLTYASSGIGGSPHLANHLFQRAVGIQALHVPYRGGAPALNDLLGGSVQFYMDGANAALPFVKAGQLRALAVTSSTRLKDLPDVPTIAETVPGFEVVSWQGLMAPAGTPQAVVDWIGNEFRRAIATPALRDKMLVQELVPIGSTQDEYRAFLERETALWQKAVAEANIRIE